MAEKFSELLGWENLTNSYVVVFYTDYNAPNLILLHPPFFEFLKGQQTLCCIHISKGL